MIVGEAGAIASLENALSLSLAYGLSRDDAIREAAKVAGVVDQWQAHFTDMGVPPSEVARLAQAIDRPYLLLQREAIQLQARAL